MKNALSSNKEINRLDEIVQPLLGWYDQCKRQLPWRENTDPYRVWVSEIMLQQTQVDTVIPYYNRFMQQVPDVATLAKLPEEQLLKLWEGLGYYSRARNLQKAAQVIMAQHGGTFPKAFDAVLALPGVGRYTAGAVCSISMDMPTPAVDGNVLRVVARLTGCADDITAQSVKDRFTDMLAKIYPQTRCGDFTQSLMELGAMLCLPKRVPSCGACPLADMCCAFKDGTQSSLPVKSKKQMRKREEKTVFLLYSGDKIAVRRRAENTLLGGMWEFPNANRHLSAEQARCTLTDWGITPTAIAQGSSRKHVFTHIEWQMISYIVTCENESPVFTWVTQQQLTDALALPSAFGLFVNRA